MSFFANLPSPPESEPEKWVAPRWHMPSENELPIPVGGPVVIARAKGATLSYLRSDVFRDGVRFALRLDTSWGRDASPETSRSLAEGPFGYREDRNAALRVGVTLADGSTAGMGNIEDADFGADAPPQTPWLVQAHGGGGSVSMRRASFDVSYWLWPLPPQGPIVLHTQYALLGLEETTIEIDLGDVAAIAANVPTLGIVPAE